MILLLRTNSREIIPKVLPFRLGHPPTSHAVAFDAWPLNETVKRVRRAARADLDILTHLGGLNARLGREVGLCYLVLISLLDTCHSETEGGEEGTVFAVGWI